MTSMVIHQSYVTQCQQSLFTLISSFAIMLPFILISTSMDTIFFELFLLNSWVIGKTNQFQDNTFICSLTNNIVKSAHQHPPFAAPIITINGKQLQRRFSFFHRSQWRHGHRNRKKTTSADHIRSFTGHGKVIKVCWTQI